MRGVNVKRQNKKSMLLVNYIIFGIMTTLVNTIVFYMLDQSNVDYKVATTIATIVSILFAYITNKIYVFKSKDWNIKFLINEFFKFTISRIGTYFLDIFSMYIFIELFYIENLKSKLLANILVIIVNYILSKVYIFRGEKK